LKRCAVLAYGPPRPSHSHDIYSVIVTYRYPVKDKTSATQHSRMAGAVNDAWNYCCQIQPEADSRWRASFAVTNEAFSRKVCSECKSIAGPNDIAGLRMRQWACFDCGALHDRDVNAAWNLLVFAGAERRPVAGEIPALKDGEDVQKISNLSHCLIWRQATH
jgi:hypothetical protein